MSNLLEKASILLTPTAYDDGKVLSVKPEDGTGDFDFTRNSSATRVNSQGLIEDVQILSGNLVSNGDFSQEGAELVTNGNFATDSDWTKQTSWSISGGAANYDFLSDAKYIRQTLLSGGFVAGKAYKINFEITSGTAYMNVSSNGGGLISLNTYSVGSYSIYVTASASGSDLLIYGRNTSGTAFSIDNVSVKEVGQGWTVINGTITDKYNASMTAYQSGIRITPFSKTGTFKVVFDLVVTSGSCKFDAGGSNNAIYSTSGTKEIIVTNTTKFEFNAFNLGWVGTLDNVSVIEITDDTNLPRINYEGFSYQDSLGSELVVNGDFSTDSNWFKDANWTIANGKATSTGVGRMFQSIPFLETNIGTTVKVSFDITELTANGVVVNCYGGVSQSFTTVGTHTFTTTTTNNTNLYFNNGGAGNLIGSIDNVSVKEYLGQEVVPDSGCGSWLFEPQSTNLVINSNSGFTSSTNMDLVYNNVTSPDGTQNAYKSTLTGTNGHVRTSNITFADTSTFSVFLKYGNNQWYQIINSAAVNFYVNVDIQNGVFGTNGSQTENLSIKNFGNGWFRVSGTFTNAAGSGTLRVYSGSSSSSNWAGASAPIGSYNYGYGFQVEAQSFATSYIPTNGSTVTRLQEAAFGSGSSDLINSTEGVLYAEIARLEGDTSGYRELSISDGTTSNSIKITLPSANLIQGVLRTNATGSLLETIISYAPIGGYQGLQKIAFKYKDDDFALWINGVEAAISTSGGVCLEGVINTFNFNRGNPVNKFYGKTKCVAVFKEALTDAELTCLTTI